jgi:hypothetical protein
MRTQGVFMSSVGIGHFVLVQPTLARWPPHLFHHFFTKPVDFTAISRLLA